MSNYNLFASVAVFRELYDSNHDVYDVIAAFERLALVLESRRAFNVTELNQLLKKHFAFEIPDAVVKTALRQRLKRDGVVDVDHTGTYTTTADFVDHQTDLIADLERLRSEDTALVNQLTEYIQGKIKGVIDKNDVASDFFNYLLDTPVPLTYTKYISSFIIENQETVGFRDRLNTIKEGLVLYSGILYSSDLNSIGVWNHDLTVYLDTEQLFNACGYNGVLFESVFNDFYALVSEINVSYLSKSGRGKIILKYFEESKRAIDDFFYVGEMITEGKKHLDPSKPAMVKIVNGSRSPSDVIIKKAEFFTKLQNLGIILESRKDFYSEVRFNVEDKRTLNSLMTQCKESGYNFDENDCSYYLKLYTRINVLRHGPSNIGFDKIGFILMSANSAAHFVANSSHVREDSNGVPFATNMDFLIDRLWFKLKKGLGKGNRLPNAIDVVTKAKLVLSTQIRNAVADKYSELRKKHNQGILSKEQAGVINAELRERASRAEDITPDNVAENLLFIDENEIESLLREKAKLQELAVRGEKAIDELLRRDIAERKRREDRLRTLIKCGRCIAIALYWIFICGLYAASIYLIYDIRTTADSTLTIIGVIITFVLGTIPIVKVKWFFRWLRKKSEVIYKRKMSDIESTYDTSKTSI